MTQEYQVAVITMCLPFKIPFCPLLISYFGYKTFFYCILNHPLTLSTTCIIPFFIPVIISNKSFYLSFITPSVLFIWEIIVNFLDSLFFHLDFCSHTCYMKPYGHLQPIRIQLVCLLLEYNYIRTHQASCDRNSI